MDLRAMLDMGPESTWMPLRVSGPVSCTGKPSLRSENSLLPRTEQIKPIRAAQKGRIAECWVEAQLRQAGWQVLAKNYRGRHFELDLVIEDCSALVVVEVKYRQKPGCGWQKELLPARKIKAIRLGIRHFLTSPLLRRQPGSVRLDLALVTGLFPRFSCQYYTSVAALG